MFDLETRRRQALKDIEDYKITISHLNELRNLLIERSNFVSNELSDPEAIDYATLSQIARLTPNPDLFQAYYEESKTIASMLAAIDSEMESFQYAIKHITQWQ